jgi:exonuclease VII small subunit
MSGKSESVSEKTAKLTRLVEWFDGSDFKLELALDKFKEAEKLALEIEKDLLSLKNEIEIVKQKFDK